jgi:hypothetical protein
MVASVAKDSGLTHEYLVWLYALLFQVTFSVFVEEVQRPPGSTFQPLQESPGQATCHQGATWRWAYWWQ